MAELNGRTRSPRYPSFSVSFQSADRPQGSPWAPLRSRLIFDGAAQVAEDRRLCDAIGVTANTREKKPTSPVSFT
jgi:hypothetical protein